MHPAITKTNSTIAPTSMAAEGTFEIGHPVELVDAAHEKGKNKAMITDSTELLKSDDSSKQETGMVDPEITPTALPRTKSQLTLLLKRDRKAAAAAAAAAIAGETKSRNSSS
jgi:hypothetical protein